MDRIGLIAGGGQFPGLFADKARKKGAAVVAAAIVNEADGDLASRVDTIEWLHLGQLGKLLKFFGKHGVTDAVFLGTVKKTRLFSDIRPDLKGLGFIASVGVTHDDHILCALADYLEKNGVRIRPSTFLLPELLAPAGCWTLKKPDTSTWKDIRIGWNIAGEIGRLDIGQCVVVAGGSVLAVEGADGTDATIRRGGGLCRGGAVVVKRSKPGQDLRFDLPTTGIETIRTMADAGAGALVIETGKSIVFDRETMVDLANRSGIAIVAVNDADLS